MPSSSRRRRRAVVSGVVCLLLAGGAVAAISARTSKAASTISTPSIFRTATVTRGDLTTTERIDGTVQLSSTLTVLHRIAGQTSSSSTSSASAPSAAAQQPASSSSPVNPSSTPPAAAATQALIGDCSTPITVPTTPQAPVPVSTAAPADTAPVGSTPDTTPAATTTTVAPTEPPTTVTATPPQPCPTTTTTPGTAPIDAGGTVPTGAAPTGVGRTGRAGTGGGGGTNGSGAATGGTRTAASTARVTQTVTSIIAINAPVQQGDVLYTVDGAPAIALDGALPAWRTMSTSIADGADIAQLEASLVALGYDPDHKVTVDDHFDSATRTMVKAWQQGLGSTATGIVTLGSVVFLPATATVSTVDRVVGDTVGDGDAVMTLASPTQAVLIDVPAGDEAQVGPGLAVAIGNVQATVTRLQSANSNGTVTVQALITPAAPIDGATNGSAVKVTLTLQNQTGVLIAPAEALVSRLDGTYAVQVKTSDGTTKFLTVELLGVSGGNVAIRATGLTEGTVLLLPV